MHIESLVLGPLQTNCYVVWDDLSRQAVVIDPADSGDVISQCIIENDLDLQAIILTHGHFDHVLGLLELKLNFPTAPIVMHQADVFLLKRAQGSALHWLGYEVDPVPPADHFVKENDEIKIGEKVLKVLETPGHTPGSICLYSDNVIFTGDTLFKDGVGSADHSYSDPKKLKESLQKIANLPGKRAMYSGHGEMFGV